MLSSRTEPKFEAHVTCCSYVRPLSAGALAAERSSSVLLCSHCPLGARVQLDAAPPLVLTTFWLLADNASSSCSSTHRLPVAAPAALEEIGIEPMLNAQCSLSGSEHGALFSLRQRTDEQLRRQLGARSYELLLIAPLAPACSSARATIS